ncbi:MAG: helix-turn-helix domain-containing protein [Flavobacteriales bacterium]|jgi:excisionase family DNA binding protein
MDLYENCTQCDSLEEKLNYLGGIVINKLKSSNDSFYQKPHYTSDEVCWYLNISKKTLDNLCSGAELRFTKPKGRRYFLREDLEDYVRQNRQRSKYKNLLDKQDLR